MKRPHIHPDDAAWLRRWLRNNVICIAAIVAFVSALRLISDDQPQLSAASQNQAQLQNQVQLQRSAIEPSGWRRTSQGWQHTSWWRYSNDACPTGVSNTEAGGATVGRSTIALASTPSVTMKLLRDYSPVAVVLIQLIAIAIIARRASNANPSRDESDRAALHANDAQFA